MGKGGQRAHRNTREKTRGSSKRVKLDDLKICPLGGERHISGVGSKETPGMRDLATLELTEVTLAISCETGEKTGKNNKGRSLIDVLEKSISIKSSLPIGGTLSLKDTERVCKQIRVCHSARGGLNLEVLRTQKRIASDFAGEKTDKTIYHSQGDF